MMVICTTRFPSIRRKDSTLMKILSGVSSFILLEDSKNFTISKFCIEISK